MELTERRVRFMYTVNFCWKEKHVSIDVMLINSQVSEETMVISDLLVKKETHRSVVSIRLI